MSGLALRTLTALTEASLTALALTTLTALTGLASLTLTLSPLSALACLPLRTLAALACLSALALTATSSLALTALTGLTCRTLTALIGLSLRRIISGCFDDCYVIRDCNQFAGSKAVYDMVNMNSIKSAQDYIEKVNRDQTYFRVYLGENASTEKLQTALDTLQDKDYKGNVYFMPVSDELLKELKASKIACFYPLSSLSEILFGYIKSIDKNEIEKLIYETREYIRAEYVPKYGSFEIIE